MRTTLFFAALLGLVPICAAQEVSRDLPMLPPDIESIEAEGAGFPTPRAGLAFPEGAEAYPTIGESERTCVAATSAPVRSGEFLVGAQIHRLRSTLLSKVWWAPLENSRDMTLLVRGRMLDAPGDTTRWESDRIAYPADPSLKPRKHEDVDDWFFPSSFRLPAEGRWVIVATSGSNWGCFVVTVS